MRPDYSEMDREIFLEKNKRQEQLFGKNVYVNKGLNFVGNQGETPAAPSSSSNKSNETDYSNGQI